MSSTITSTTTIFSTTATSTSTSTSTTTVYYHITGGVAKRQEAATALAEPNAVAKRDTPNIPIWLKPFASSIISNACSCLSIPTPSVTNTQTSTSTTVTTVTPAVVIQTISTFGVTTVTTTVTQTSTSSAVTNSQVTIITASTTTTTVPAAAVSTVSFPAACSAPPAHFYFPEIQRGYITQYTETGSDVESCCAACYMKPNCILYVWYYGSPECGLVIAVDTQTVPADPGLAAVCPLGISSLPQYFENDTNDGVGGYNSGPCDVGAPL